MIDQAVVDDLVRDAARVSDRGVEGLTAFAKAFISAHEINPGELSLEIGTRDGGSAILFLGLLAHLYPVEHRPTLFTVDPYGSKPYEGGDINGAPIYTDVNYIRMKTLLAPFPNHVHFQMTSTDFFDRIYGMPYWRPGRETAVVQSAQDGARVSVPVGEMRHAADLAFALLDGQHDAWTIEQELDGLFGEGSWMAEGGLAVVDNVDADPRTRRMLERGMANGVQCFRVVEFSANGQWAIVR